MISNLLKRAASRHIDLQDTASLEDARSGLNREKYRIPGNFCDKKIANLPAGKMAAVLDQWRTSTF